MSMISIINEAINRKLASTSFTTIIKGVVTDLNPLKIKINDRITIGLDFIEPKSLGINDDSPSPALPLIVGESVDMIRYNNGQRFYVLGKSVTPGSSSYLDLTDKPKLNTNNASSQAVNSSEEINGTIKLHKISKTGKYSDLVDAPNLATVATSGSYNDLSNKPTIPAEQVQSDWNITSTSSKAYIKNKPSLATVATSGNYSDLNGKPDILEFEVVDTWS